MQYKLLILYVTQVTYCLINISISASAKKTILNLLTFQVGWFVCVVGGDIYAALYLPLALLLYRKFVMANPEEWKLVVLVALVGIL